MVGWFEIPVLNMDRAVKFYESVFDVKLSLQDFGALKMAWFPWVEGGLGSSGSLVMHLDHYKPSQEGVLVYFTALDMNGQLAKIEKEGGKGVQGRTLIAPDIGYMAIFIDSEGNRIALHSRH